MLNIGGNWDPLTHSDRKHWLAVHILYKKNLYNLEKTHFDWPLIGFQLITVVLLFNKKNYLGVFSAINTT